MTLAILTTLTLTTIPGFAMAIFQDALPEAWTSWVVLVVGSVFVIGSSVCMWQIWGTHSCPRCQARALRFKVPKGADEWYLTCSACGLYEATGEQSAAN